MRHLKWCESRSLLVSALITWAGCLGSTSSANAQTTILDFEDLSPGGAFQPMPVGYGGINWSDVFWPYDTPQDPFNPRSGAVRVASNRVPRPDDPIPRGQFQFVIPGQVFNGAWFAGPNPPQVVQVQFLLYDDGLLVHSSATMQVSPVPTFLASGYSGPVDAVTIVGKEGEYVFDDLSYSTPPSSFYTVTPCRVFDTREPSGPTLGAPLTCGTVRSFTVAGQCGVPVRATALSVNLTGTGSTAQGNLRLFASGLPPPLVSSLNYVAGQTRANNAVVGLGTGGQISVLCSLSGTTHVVLDVNGYFQ